MRPTRKILISLTLGCALFGAALVGGLFTRALGLPADAGALLARVNVSELAPGHFMLVDGRHQWRGAFNQSVHDGFLILRMHDGELRAFWMVRRDGATGMPDGMRWWVSYVFCRRFGPAPALGAFKSGALIQCHDEDLSPWQREAWRWDLHGRVIAADVYAPAMERVSVDQEPGGWIVLGKRKLQDAH